MEQVARVADIQSVHKLSNCSGVVGSADAAAAAAGPAAATAEGSRDPASHAMAEGATPAIVPPALHTAPAPVHTAGTPSLIVAETVVATAYVHALAAALAAAAPVAAAAVAALAAVATMVDPSMSSTAVEAIVRAQRQPCAAASHPASAPSLMTPTDLRQEAQALEKEGVAAVLSSACVVVWKADDYGNG